jgi:hypothetical protein
MSDEGEFVVHGNVLYWKCGESEERVGHGYEEIGLWFRKQLAKDLRVEVDSPEYNAAVDRIFGGDE